MQPGPRSFPWEDAAVDDAPSMQNPVPGDFAPREGEILIGSLFSEPMRVETVRSTGPASWVLGLVGVSSERFRSVTLTAAELATLKVFARDFLELKRVYFLTHCPTPTCRNYKNLVLV